MNALCSRCKEVFDDSRCWPQCPHTSLDLPRPKTLDDMDTTPGILPITLPPLGPDSVKALDYIDETIDALTRAKSAIRARDHLAAQALLIHAQQCRAAAHDRLNVGAKLAGEELAKRYTVDR